MTNRTPRRRSENQVTASVGKAGGFCTSTRSGRAQPPQRAPEAEADPRGVEQAGDRVAGSGQLARGSAAVARFEPVDGNPRLVGDRARQRRAFEPDEVDVDAVRRQRLRVVPHAGAASQISEGNDGGSH